MNLELLRLKYPAVYELLYRDTEAFLKTEPDSHQKNAYCLKAISGQRINNLNSNDVSNYEITAYLKENFESLSVPKNEILKIVALLIGVFSNETNFIKKNHLSVVYPSNFNKYFRYALSSGNLSEVEFSKHRRKESSEFNGKISDWVEQGLELELQRRLEEITTFDDKFDFENVINAIFYLANHDTKTQKTYKSKVGFNGENLKSKLNDYDNNISNRLYSDYDGKGGYRKFLFGIFKSAKPNYEFECDFISEILKLYPKNFPIEQKELETIVIEYFRKYCDSTHTFDWQIWRLFHNCKVKDWEPAGGNSYTVKDRFLEDAKTVFKQFTWNKDTRGILTSLIDRDLFKKQRYILSEMIPVIWGDWDTFHSEFLSIPDSKFKTEFEAFFQKLSSSSFSQYVEFDFKEVDLKKRFKD